MVRRKLNIPEWLGRALESSRGSEQDIEGLIVTRRPAPGDLRIARPSDSGLGSNRLVVVVDVNEEAKRTSVVLVSNEIEYSCDFDVKLESGEAYVPYDLMVECDIVAPLWLSQVEVQIGKLPDALFATVAKAVNGDFSDVERGRRGSRIRGRSDPRWEFRELELESLNTLALDCVTRMTDGALLDPAIFSVVAALDESSKVDLLSRLSFLQTDVIITSELLESMLDISLHLDPDAQAALEFLVQRVGAEHSERVVGDDVESSFQGDSYSIYRERAISRIYEQGRDVVHLATLPELFESPGGWIYLDHRHESSSILVLPEVI